ncbi:hypothetical protein [Nonomuraea sp. NEAU-A123]|uniref:hypothetical protein n=1 Tax=Nonomuraea sp. NEAU-A123 TaxID=2839649 RepID=UPI001BE4D703|nr:hypothetical protein [Nonomuraea sp. NEAU-A123]MBT2226252.1 hypothetical protein [Nonomuraea sp. NEAU-A123]
MRRITIPPIIAAALLLGGCSSPVGTAASTPAADAPFSTVPGPDGKPVTVPSTLPEDCRHAFVQIGGPLMSAREGFKAMLVGASPADVTAGAERVVNAWSMLESPTVESALLDCSSQSRNAGPAFRNAVEAVGSQHIAAGLVAGSGELPFPGRGNTSEALELVETALAATT